MIHHYRAYGFWAPAVGDYVTHGIMDRMNDPRFDALLALPDLSYGALKVLLFPAMVVAVIGLTEAVAGVDVVLHQAAGLEPHPAAEVRALHGRAGVGLDGHQVRPRAAQADLPRRFSLDHL